MICAGVILFIARPKATLQMTLLSATSRDSREEVLAALQAGANPNSLSVGTYRMTPLILAAKLQLFETAKLLLAAGADPNVKDSSGRSALFYILIYGHNTKDEGRFIVELLRHGAQTNEADLISALGLLQPDDFRVEAVLGKPGD